MEVHFADGEIVGTSFTDKDISAEKGQAVSLKMIFDTSRFTKGLYKCTAVIFVCDEYGHQAVLDHVENALTFSVMESEEEDVIWLSQYWGHLHLHDIRVKTIERDS